ncbi:MAG: hypothetical protein GY715_05760, partial [Planctomycetes bacterium]|nr:hypothetical protein [Planctomycetota bacterium]
MNEREWREQIDEHESNHHELSPEDCPVLTCRLAAKIRELEGRLKRRRMFPIMDGPAVPWEAMEQHEGQAQQNHWQSLQELASRGGLDVLEAWCVVDAIPFRDCPDNVSQLWEDYAYHWNDLVRRAEADAKALQR